MARTVVEEVIAEYKGDTRGIERASKRASKAVDNFSVRAQKSSRKASAGFLKLNKAIGVVAVSMAAIGTVRTADKFTELSQKLKNVTRDTKEYESVLNSLVSISQEFGADLSGLSDAYVKLNISLSDSVRDSVDLVKVTKILTRGFAASGTAASTAAGATLQLTQGLATDFKAAGQELNSIIEGAPLLARTIAIQLGGNAAVDLKRFAEEGKLTAKIFLEALIASEDAINSFKLPKTAERSVQRLKNELLLLVGVLDKTLGVTEKLTFFMDGLALAAGVLRIRLGRLDEGEMRMSRLAEETQRANEQFMKIVDSAGDMQHILNSIDPLSTASLFPAPKPSQKPFLDDEKMAKFRDRQRKLEQQGTEKIRRLEEQRFIRVNDRAKEYERTLEDIKRRTIENRNEMSDFIFSGVRGFESLRDVAVRALEDIARNIMRVGVFGGSSSGGLTGTIGAAIGGLLGGGGSAFGVQGVSAAAGSRNILQVASSAAGGAFGPGFATGGSVMEDRTTGGPDNQMVSIRKSRNERLTISRPGQKNGGLGGAQPIVVNNSYNFTTGIQNTVRAEILQLMPAISRQVQGDVLTSIKRGGSMAKATGVQT